MTTTNWTQPILEEIRQAEIKLAQHKKNLFTYMDIIKTLSYIKDPDTYQKFRALKDAEQHDVDLATYRIKSLRYHMNYDLGYYDNDNNSRYEEEADDNE